jgi:hypothetical protein
MTIRHEMTNGMMHHREDDIVSSHSDGVTCSMCPGHETAAAADPAPAARPELSKASVATVDPTTGWAEHQEVSGTPDVVAAWLRAMADRMVPVAPAKPGCRCAPGGRARGLDVLPPARH